MDCTVCRSFVKHLQNGQRDLPKFEGEWNPLHIRCQIHVQNYYTEPDWKLSCVSFRNLKEIYVLHLRQSIRRKLPQTLRESSKINISFNINTSRQLASASENISSQFNMAFQFLSSSTMLAGHVHVVKKRIVLKSFEI